MSTQANTSAPRKPALSEKAQRLLAAHDREVKGYVRRTTPARRATRWS